MMNKIKCSVMCKLQNCTNQEPESDNESDVDSSSVPSSNNEIDDYEFQ